MELTEFSEWILSKEGKEAGQENTPEYLVRDALKREDYAAAAAQLGISPDAQLPENAAGDMLLAGLDASPEFFGRLLSRCARKDDCATLAGRLDKEGHPFQLTGTLATLAAALGKTEHLALLLERGWDANSASNEAREHLLQLHKENPDLLGVLAGVRGGKNTGPDSLLKWGHSKADFFDGPCARLLGAWSDPYVHLPGLTPLAAAIFFGNMDCVALLLRQPGVWIAENGAVSAALCCRCADPDAENCKAAVYAELARREKDNRQPQLLCLPFAARFAAIEAFRQELARVRYPDALLAQTARSLIDSAHCENAEGLLEVLEAEQGQIFERPEVQNALLERLGAAPKAEPYLGLFLRHCGEKTNLAPVLFGMEVKLPDSFNVCCKTGKAFETLLAALAKKTSCYVEADCVPPHIAAGKLRVLARYAEIIPNPGDDYGLSGLSRAVLMSGSLRLAEFAARRGWLAEERTALLRALLQSGKTGLRAFVLTLPPSTATAAPKEPACRRFRSYPADEGEKLCDKLHLMEELQAGSYTQPRLDFLLSAMIDAEEACLWYHADFSARPQEELLFFYPGADGARVWVPDLVTALVCAGNVEAFFRLQDCPGFRQSAQELHLPVSFRPAQQPSAVSARFARREKPILADAALLNGGALCVAAVLNRLDFARECLSRGFDEDGLNGYFCNDLQFGEKKYLVTPLTLSLWMRQEEMAALLSENGADMTAAKRLLSHLPAYEMPD